MLSFFHSTNRDLSGSLNSNPQFPTDVSSSSTSVYRLIQPSFSTNSGMLSTRATHNNMSGDGSVVVLGEKYWIDRKDDSNTTSYYCNDHGTHIHILKKDDISGQYTEVQHLAGTIGIHVGGGRCSAVYAKHVGALVSISRDAKVIVSYNKYYDYYSALLDIFRYNETTGTYVKSDEVSTSNGNVPFFSGYNPNPIFIYNAYDRNFLFSPDGNRICIKEYTWPNYPDKTGYPIPKITMYEYNISINQWEYHSLITQESVSGEVEHYWTPAAINFDGSKVMISYASGFRVQNQGFFVCGYNASNNTWEIIYNYTTTSQEQNAGVIWKLNFSDNDDIVAVDRLVPSILRFKYNSGTNSYDHENTQDIRSDIGDGPDIGGVWRGVEAFINKDGNRVLIKANQPFTPPDNPTLYIYTYVNNIWIKSSSELSDSEMQYSISMNPDGTVIAYSIGTDHFMATGYKLYELE